jgi:hypothetical protein
LASLLLVVSPLPYRQVRAFLDRPAVACPSVWADLQQVLVGHHHQVASAFHQPDFQEEFHRLALEGEEDRVCHQLAVHHRDLEALRLALVVLRVALLLDFSHLLASKVDHLDREGGSLRRQDLEAGR